MDAISPFSIPDRMRPPPMPGARARAAGAALAGFADAAHAGAAPATPGAANGLPDRAQAQGRPPPRHPALGFAAPPALPQHPAARATEARVPSDTVRAGYGVLRKPD